MTVEELTAEGFEPFGRIVATPSRPPDATAATWRWWAETATLPDAGPWAVGYLQLDPGPSAFDWAERHLRSEELVVPVHGELVVYAGPPDQGEEPAADRFRLFRLRPRQAAILARGVWHGAPLAVSGPATALVLLREGTGKSDTYVARFQPIAVEVER
jgi:ureidoglycolate lyase